MGKPRKPDEEVLRVLSLLSQGRKWAVVRAETGWAQATISQAKSWFVSLSQEEAEAYVSGYPDKHRLMRLRIGQDSARPVTPPQAEATPTKRQEEHIRALLDLIRKCRENLYTSTGQRQLVGASSSGGSPPQAVPGWQVGDKGARLSILPEADKDPLTRRLWDSLRQHLSSGGSRWIVDKVTQWEATGGMELEGRAKLRDKVECLVKERIAAPDWGSVRRAKGKPTPLFAANVVSALVDGVQWDYPPVGAPRDGRHSSYCGDFSIGSATTPEAARAFQLYHQKLIIDLAHDPVTDSARAFRLQRETIAAAIDEGLAEMLASGHIPGACVYCNGGRGRAAFGKRERMG